MKTDMFKTVLALVVFATFMPGMALAGTGGTEFNTAYTMITGWMNGDLGKLIVVALLITGIGMGIVRQSVMAAVPAIAAGLVFAVSGDVVDQIITAVI